MGLHKRGLANKRVSSRKILFSGGATCGNQQTHDIRVVFSCFKDPLECITNVFQSFLDSLHHVLIVQPRPIQPKDL